MHLLVAQPGAVSDGSEAIDLGQTPGDIVVLSAADTELACLAAARSRQGSGAPSLRLANLMHLAHPLSVDTYVDKVIRHARLVVVRLLGGIGYWRYGVEQIVAASRARGFALALLPGDDQPDADLAALSVLPYQATYRLWQYLVHGGIDNAFNLLEFAASLIGHQRSWHEPRPLMRAGLYWPDVPLPNANDIRSRWRTDAPVAAIVFYRALVQAAKCAPVDALISALERCGVNSLPIFVVSLKDPISAAFVAEQFEGVPPAVILNATGFAVSNPNESENVRPFDAANCPVLQVVFSGSSQRVWREGWHGLSARDIAMNVALPEIDGRILSRAVSFKTAAHHDPETQTDVIAYEPVADRVDFVAALAANWARLRATPTASRRVAIVLANYPNRDGRIGNGVGLDTPASTINVLHALAGAGYSVEGNPGNGAALISRLQAGPTNDAGSGANRDASETLRRAEYLAFFETLPSATQKAVTDRWGTYERDPFFVSDVSAFAIPVVRFGNVALGIQPARGYNIDPVQTYHTPDLVPPHGYLAFYAWLRTTFGAHAIVHMGKHGNLEWLPGKALALSAECFPEAALGPVPHLYPFIVNDPGEGCQAKRRTSAVIVDHLTPPMARAESYGPLRDLEQLVDEYYEAATLDPRRTELLRRDILELSQRIGLDEDAGITAADEAEESLLKLDRYLCEIKEMQIRDGLHVFGEAPQGDQLASLLVALVRLPRGTKRLEDYSLLRALAADLDLDVDPLDADMAHRWVGPRPAAFGGSAPWRNHGDVIEQLEKLALALVAGEREADPHWTRTRKVLAEVDSRVRPAVVTSGKAEISGIIDGLDGQFVAPGASGAPTRGRLEVLPTGRNFFSIDTRSVPTPAAWQLGWKSAALLVERHLQEHGEWPKTMAISAWGTANMRTGGDDIAQVLALMGVRPSWDDASRRVNGFEILPHATLDRPRVDVTLRVSGFFRDAFPNLIDLVDSAVRAVAELNEPEAVNPLAARVKSEARSLVDNGVPKREAQRRAGHRIFGSKPGSYGAGLQALIDERGWKDEADLARAYLAWSGYAYGAGVQGAAEHALFERRMSTVDAVVQNQDNREHDILDSDDYYQFEGGLAVTVRNVSGKQPALYHNDHSRPERPKVRTLAEEVARVVRARVVNPKWIEGVMRHGYKGAFEMAATVDYLFAFAATAKAVKDHHFDAVFEAYVHDPKVRAFLAENNPSALREIGDRLLEAQERGLWRPRANIAFSTLADIASGECKDVA